MTNTSGAGTRRQTKYWCFTDNNYPEDMNYGFLTEHVEYCVYQLEKGEENERLHMQGTVIFKRYLRFNDVKRIFTTNPHIEMCRSISASIKYCTKEETRVSGPFFIGVKPDLEKIDRRMTKGKSLDSYLAVDKLKLLIDQGLDYTEIYELYPDDTRKHSTYVQEKIKKRKINKYTRPDVIRYVYGPPGCGKSSLIRMMCKSENKEYFIHDMSNKFYDGYNKQTVVILEELLTGKVKINEHNMLMNGDIKKLPIKGSSVDSYIKELVYISNFDIYTLSGNAIQIEAFKRRITEQLTFTREGNEIKLVWVYMSNDDIPYIKLEEEFVYSRHEIFNSVTDIALFKTNKVKIEDCKNIKYKFNDLDYFKTPNTFVDEEEMLKLRTEFLNKKD